MRTLMTAVVSLLLWLVGAIASNNAIALTSLQITDLSYQDCPAEYSEGVVTSTGTLRRGSCYTIVGKAINSTGKLVVDADVFGRIYDADGNPALQNRTRLGSIPEVPPGESEFSLRVTVPANITLPLRLEQFKASGFAGKVRIDRSEENPSGDRPWWSPFSKFFGF